MLQQLGWPTLERRRSEAKATMMYKIINNLVQVNQRDLICNYSNTRGHPFRFIHLPSRIDVSQEKQGIFAYVRGLPPQKRKAVQSRTYAAFVMKRS